MSTRGKAAVDFDLTPFASQTFEIEYRKGDIFDNTKPGTLLLHSCNCQGSWGKGIALTFKKLYAGAFTVYATYCKSHMSDDVIGRALVCIPPKSEDSTLIDGGVYIGCLFVKKKPGKPRNQAEKDMIKDATKVSLRQLMSGLGRLQEEDPSVDIREIRMPKINSGIFQVPWEETANVISQTKIPSSPRLAHLTKIIVYTG